MNRRASLPRNPNAKRGQHKQAEQSKADFIPVGGNFGGVAALRF